MAESLLEVRKLTKVFGSGLLSRRQTVALDNFSLTIPQSPATIVAIAGESGSGKSTLANLILGFLSPTSGQVLYRGHDIQTLRRSAWRTFRREVQAIFQDPFETYNAFYRADAVLELVIRKFGLAGDRATARRLIEEALKPVGLRPEEVLGKYPHELSGGQRQRIMVARALLLRPRLIVADEPVSMVDASLRAMILEIMLRLKHDFGVSFLYITHDLSTAYQISDSIYVLYRGTIAEMGDVQAVIPQPRHPYTQLLVSTIPQPNPRLRWQGEIIISPDEELQRHTATGCTYVDRCPLAMADLCPSAPPPLYQVGAQHQVACYLYRQHSVALGLAPSGGQSSDHA